MRRPRHLSPEDLALWEMVARQTRRLGKPVSPRAPDPPPQVPQVAPPEAENSPLPAFRLGEKVDHRRANNLLPGLAQDMGRAPVKMDARAFTRMKRGKLRPDGRIDLHGMTLAQAHPALTGFILSSAAQGRRLVLVITGKGRPRDDNAPMPFGAGLLRRQVPLWLGQAPIAPHILQIAPAHISHGGEGALYVYLRRPR